MFGRLAYMGDRLADLGESSTWEIGFGFGGLFRNAIP